MSRVNTMYAGAIAAPPGTLAPRSSRAGMIAYLRALTLTFWFGTLVFQFWYKTDWFAVVDLIQSGANLKAYYYIGFGIALIGHLTLGLQKWISAPFSVLATVPGRLLTLFCVLMLLLSPLSTVPRTSGVYAIGTWIVFVVCRMYWASDYNVSRRVLNLTGFLLFAWLAVLLVHHGLSRGFGGAIGGINRNATSTVAVAAMVCCALSPNRKILYGGIGAAVFFAVIVTSRGSLLALGVFVAAYYTLEKGTSKAFLHACLALGAAGVLLIASSFLQQAILEDVLHLSDKTRGIGTGLTGRMELWKHAIQVFWESPIIGHGFRSTSGGALGGAHSGYLKIFAEGGIVGGSLILSAVIIELLRRMRLAQQYRALRPVDTPGIDPVETARLNRVACAMLCVTMTLWVYEPLYINVGSVISVMFFLMVAAPSYVSAPDAGWRR